MLDFFTTILLYLENQTYLSELPENCLRILYRQLKVVAHFKVI
jgi:hypothetical protein